MAAQAQDGPAQAEIDSEMAKRGADVVKVILLGDSAVGKAKYSFISFPLSCSPFFFFYSLPLLLFPSCQTSF
jgi:hypothetical protein